MSKNVQRFLLKAHAKESNTRYYPWTIVTLLILIRDDDKERAFDTAKKLIAQRQWVPISAIHRSTLIEQLVLQESREAVELYNEVKEGKVQFKVITDSWCGFKDSPPLLFPRITEKFIDEVIKQAGGKRYDGNIDTNKKNADYLIEDYIFELKIIEEERLVHDTVQNKLAELLEKGLSETEISSHGMDSLDYSTYTNIFRPPIENAIKYASKQIKATAEQLCNKNLKGGLIIINNGTSSFTPKVFNDCVIKSIGNNSSIINAFIAVNIWSETKNLDTKFRFRIEPNPPTTLVQSKIHDSFVLIMNNFLTHWAQQGFSQDNYVDPLKTLSFEKYGIIFIKPGQHE